VSNMLISTETQSVVTILYA